MLQTLVEQKNPQALHSTKNISEKFLVSKRALMRDPLQLCNQIHNPLQSPCAKHAHLMYNLYEYVRVC